MSTPAALLTLHRKAMQIAPALAAVGIEVQSTEAFDTDTLGTFAGETPRTLSPLACARAKAQQAIALTGLPLGMGSEGSFGGGPMPGFLNWDEELLLLIDSRTGQEIIAVAAGPVALSAVESDNIAVLQAHIAKHDAAQGWILRYPAGLVKGLIGEQALVQALMQAEIYQAGALLAEKVQLQPDFRAHLCPARQGYIQQAAEQLAQRLLALCPSCQAPDFWRKQAEPGLPCELCDYPTSQVKYYIKSCNCCGHKEQEAAATVFASAVHCPLCNP
ncbi:hypothetical protein GCM10010919_03830 [Alishewanella longhuensis]|uniref:DUF6671 domain-containing protein n=1 Tax=Alishewanella longhuensis TaxID=1091037 RepID=A0ABQ3KU98_9ALTE|nr:DUF6671 family protein [Alishewanella longhuensis]GHG60397.1 hypothetical protein GCM10010919_03830 [Alishewanella longhuensis]